jgi:hypothetical protein
MRNRGIRCQGAGIGTQGSGQRAGFQILKLKFETFSLKMVVYNEKYYPKHT